MSNTIRIKRRVSGATGAPTTLKSAELAYNMADDTIYAGYGDDGSGNATSVKPVGGEGTFAKLASPALTGVPTAPTASLGTNTNQIATTAFVQSAMSGAGAGSVTSVALSLPTSVFSVSGSPVTSAGTLTGTFASQAANKVFAAPNGASGTPSFRALVAADIPALSYLASSGGTVSGNLVVSGDLTVNGTTTTVNSTTVDVKDKNITLGNVATPSDATADGGGITLLGATNKTLIWVDATDAWTSSEHFNIASGKSFSINGTAVISGSSLGTGVTASSLTSVGVLTSGTWNASVIGLAYGGSGADLSGAANGAIFKKSGTALVAATAGTDYLNDASVVDGGTF